jgi:hypothetical protein
LPAHRRPLTPVPFGCVPILQSGQGISRFRRFHDAPTSTLPSWVSSARARKRSSATPNASLWVRAANDNKKILAVAGRFPFPSGRREPAPNAGRTWTRADFRRQGPRAMGHCAKVAVAEVRNARRNVRECPRARRQFWLAVLNLVGDTSDDGRLRGWRAAIRTGRPDCGLAPERRLEAVPVRGAEPSPQSLRPAHRPVERRPFLGPRRHAPDARLRCASVWRPEPARGDVDVSRVRGVRR